MTKASDEWEAARYANRRLRERLSPSRGAGGSAFGIAVAVLSVIVTAIVARLSPSPAPFSLTDGTAVVLADGRIFVMDDGTLHPSPNLTSALLAAATVEYVADADLTGRRFGEPRGIPGAVTTLPTALLSAQWQLCDGPESTPTLTVGAAAYLPPPAGETALLDDGTARWLVADGIRAPSDDGAAQAIAVAPQLVELLAESPRDIPRGEPAYAAVACAQSDASAPFALPSSAAIARDHQEAAPMNNSIRVVLPPDTGLLVRLSGGAGYLLLTFTGELAPIADDAALARLGYRPQQAVDAPEALLAALDAGPELSIEAARTPVSTIAPLAPPSAVEVVE